MPAFVLLMVIKKPLNTLCLQNLYFTYLLELRALQKVAPYLRGQLFYTGDAQQDAETRRLIADIRTMVNGFQHHFDETQMFLVGFAHACFRL